MEDDEKNVEPVYTESLDYQTIYNRMQSERRQLAKHEHIKILGVKPYTIVKSFVTLAIAVSVGLLTVGLAIVTEFGVVWKNHMVRAILHDAADNNFLRAIGFHLVFSNILVLIGASLVQLYAPAAAGSGVSLVMAYLNGNAVPDLLTFRTLLAKWIGTMCACTANLTLGLEAPMVHLGACVAHCITHATCSLCARWDEAREKWRARRAGEGLDREVAAGPQWLPRDIIATDADQREFISAGAAAGLAAAFGAPIGGVLFSMEEAATHWSRKVAWRCFVCTAVCVFTISLLSSRWRKGVLSPGDGVTPLDTQEWFMQLPFVILVSCGGAFLGALFNALHKLLLPYRAPTKSTVLRLLEVCVLTTVIISSMFGLAYWLGTCVQVPEWVHQSYGFTFHCKGDTFNDLATAFFSVPNDTIKHIFSLGQYSEASQVCEDKNCYFTLRSLMVLCPAYLVFMTLIGGLAIPGGLFIPSILVGSSFGATMGLLLMRAYPTMNIQPGFYAMCAATAMLGSVFRSYISLVVLVVEGTQSTKFMLGIIVAAMCSNYIVEWIHSDGVYETDLEADGQVVFLRATPPTALLSTTASHIMSKAVWCFREVESVRYIVGVLQRTSHNGFPVVHPPPGRRSGEETDDEYDPDTGGPSRSGVMKGIMLRSQLLVLLHQQAFCDEGGRLLGEGEAADTQEQRLELDRLMRMFFRHHYFMRRHEASQADALPLAYRDGDGYEGTAKRMSGEDSPSPPSPPSDATSSGGGPLPLPPMLADWDIEAAIPPDLYLDLRPFMDQEPITVRPDTPGERVHSAFVSLGMRHLVVVDSRSHVRGIITRKDLDAAAGHGGWRRNKMAPAPKPPPPEGLHVDPEGGILNSLRRTLASFSDLVGLRSASTPPRRPYGSEGMLTSLLGSPAESGDPVDDEPVLSSAWRPWGRTSSGRRASSARPVPAHTPNSEGAATPFPTPVHAHYLAHPPTFPSQGPSSAPSGSDRRTASGRVRLHSITSDERLELRDGQSDQDDRGAGPETQR